MTPDLSSWALPGAPPPAHDGYFALIVDQGAAGSDELNAQMTTLAVAQQSAVELRSSWRPT
jgi:hypothetical protein